MPGEIITQIAIENFAQDGLQLGIEGLGKMKEVLIGAALPIGALYLKSKMGGGGSNDKPAEVSEARIRVLKPWESGLLFKNGSLYKSIPAVDTSGNQQLVDGEQQFEKRFHKLLTPGLRGGVHGLSPLRKMLIVNNLPDQFNMPLIRAEGPDNRLSDLEAGIIWHHVSATDQYGREASYEFNNDAPDGKSWKAGPISAAEALNFAVMSATTRAEKAKQLGSILVPVIQSRLQGESDPLKTSLDPAFSEAVEFAVHDRFLARGAMLDQVNVGASYNPAVRGNELIANAIIKGLQESFNTGNREKDETYEPPIDVASRVASQESHTGFGIRPAAHVHEQ